MTGFPSIKYFWPQAAWAALLAMVAVGCAARDTSTVMESRPLGKGGAILTSADVRLISVTPKGTGSFTGRIDPQQITCVEPSPDIAKAVSSNFSLGGSLGLGGLPSGVSADLALAFAKSRAEAVAQMTERLATIQLLRDGLYRACEAYANGAISDTTYAVMLSRYDDTMITLLLGELAAGNFGRQLATLGGGAGGGSSALLDKAVGDQEKAGEAAKSLEEANTKVGEKERAVGAAQSELNGTAAGTPERSAADAKLGQANAELEAAKAKRDALKKIAEQRQFAAANSSATAFANTATGGVAGSNLTAKDRGELAGHLATMQRKYIENINTDALLVACISALDRPNAAVGAIQPKLDDLGTAYEALLAKQKAAIGAKSANPSADANVVAARKVVLAKASTLSATAASSGLSPLAAYCLSGIIPEFMLGQQRILETILTRNAEERKTVEYRNAIADLEGLTTKLKALKAAMP